MSEGSKRVGREEVGICREEEASHRERKRPEGPSSRVRVSRGQSDQREQPFEAFLQTRPGDIRKPSGSHTGALGSLQSRRTFKTFNHTPRQVLVTLMASRVCAFHLCVMIM